MKRQVARLKSAVHIATLHWNKTKRAFDIQLALSPMIIEGNDTVVVRVDDVLHRAWDRDGAARVSEGLDAALGKLRSLGGRGMAFTWQLDYDVPVRLLDTWAAALGALRAPKGALAGQRLWITSLISHALAPGYQRTMEGRIDGHVLQIFDTHDPLTSDLLTRVERVMVDATVPFTIGVSPLYRGQSARGVQPTWVRTLAKSSNFAGTWIFPAGMTRDEWPEELP